MEKITADELLKLINAMIDSIEKQSEPACLRPVFEWDETNGEVFSLTKQGSFFSIIFDASLESNSVTIYADERDWFSHLEVEFSNDDTEFESLKKRIRPYRDAVIIRSMLKHYNVT